MIVGEKSMGSTPSQTPLRDQLNINPEDSVDYASTVSQQQFEMRAQLRAGLGSLPAPKNDFEIVLPENEVLPEEDIDSKNITVEDAADIEGKNAERRLAEGIQYF